jgi:hypothetical protein
MLWKVYKRKVAALGYEWQAKIEEATLLRQKKSESSVRS